MPTYEYRCAKCGEDVEVWQSFADAPLTKHDDCGGKLQRVLSPAGIVLKGSGFYKTDNRSSSKRGSGSSSDHGSGSKGDSGAKSDSSGSSDSGSSSSKPSDSSGSSSGSSEKSKSDAKSA